MATIQGIYIALFGRPADPLGLAYFNEQTGNGANLTAIGDLASTAEYQDRFAGMSNDEIVTAIYQSLFKRNPELAGLQFFVNELNSGRQNINTIAINILDGAQGADLQMVNNKIAAANAFTTALNEPDEIAAYRGEAAADAGRAFLNPVTEDPSTIPTPAATDAAIAALVAGPGPQPGDTFTLTASPDNIMGTANIDTFRAINPGTLQSTDTLNGAGGPDILNISAGALVAGASPVISAIERINNSDANKVFNLSAVNGAEQIWTNPGGAATNSTYNEAQLATRFGYENTGFSGAVTINYRDADLNGATDTALLAANNPGTVATFNVVAADATKVEAVNLIAAGPAGAATPTGFAVINSFNAARTLTVTGDGNLSIFGNTITVLTTVDASATTGINIINAQGSTQNMTVTGGSGNGQYFTGSGNDILDGGLGADSYAGGAGADTYMIKTTTIEVGANDTIFATHFTTGTDKIEFGGPAGSATNYVEVAVAGTDFLVARSAAIAQLAGNAALDYVAVQNASGVFVFYDGNGDNTLSTNGSDHAVLVAGITNAQIAATDII
jgi:Ca2+-binding RTX toxin-like protein